MNAALFQIAVIFMPGILWERVDALYALRHTPTQFDIVRRSFVYGLTAYIVTYCLYSLFGFPFYLFQIQDNSLFPDPKSVYEIVSASVIALVLAVIWLYATTYKLSTRFVQLIRATKRFGDEDVWDYMFNSQTPGLDYVHLRDFNKQLIYAGFVELYSETDKLRELVLRYVKIYDFEGNEILDTPRVYIARTMDNIDIEFPNNPTERPD